MIDKLQKGCKMKISQIDNSEDDNATYSKKIDRIENYEPCDKKLPFFDDVDRIRLYIKKWFVSPFAKQHEISRDIVTDGEYVGDYEDIDKAYEDGKHSENKDCDVDIDLNDKIEEEIESGDINE